MWSQYNYNQRNFPANVNFKTSKCFRDKLWNRTQIWHFVYSHRLDCCLFVLSMFQQFALPSCFITVHLQHYYESNVY